MDYGGIGIRAEFLPTKYIGVFGSVGYPLIDPAYNAGNSAKLLPDKKLCPAIVAMYGYNAVIKVNYFQKIYYGPTVGAIGELKIGQRLGSKLNFGVLMPFRNSEFREEINQIDEKIIPIAFSLGVNFGVSTKSNKNNS
jgi:hypothetical protein